MSGPVLVERRILLLDDDREFAAHIRDLLAAHYEVSIRYSGTGAVEAVTRDRVEVVLLDLSLGSGPSGLDVLERLTALDDPPRVIMLTGDDNLQTVVKCIQAGADDYIRKPPNPQALRMRIDRCLKEVSLVRRTRLLARRIEEDHGGFIAEDPLSRLVVRQIEKVGPTDATVLITGDSGTGKEMVAHALHKRSRRAGRIFLPVNCTAISPSLMESTLFGHEKGAFTGAITPRAGQFELADGGTLFLDEVGDSPPELQQKLLRVIETGRFMRVGGDREVRTNVRLVAATNADLDIALHQGRFREDLFHRLNVYRIHLPPLRERPGDILPLAEQFLVSSAASLGKSVKGFSEAAQRFLLSSEWRGNIRDLRNAVERAVINCERDRIGVGDLSLGGPGSRYALLPRDEAKKRADHDFYVSYLTTQLAMASGSLKEAAARSGILPQSFSRLCRDHGIR